MDSHKVGNPLAPIQLTNEKFYDKNDWIFSFVFVVGQHLFHMTIGCDAPLMNSVRIVRFDLIIAIYVREWELKSLAFRMCRR